MKNLFFKMFGRGGKRANLQQTSASSETVAGEKTEARWSSHWVSGCIGATLAAGLGVGLFLLPPGKALDLLSYDLLFAARPDTRPEEAAIIYMDEVSHQELRQPFNAPWDRSLHARLVEFLTANHARTIVFDILFTDPSADAAADARFAAAIERHGNVILGGNFLVEDQAQGRMVQLELPEDRLRKGAAGVGHLSFPLDPGYVIRRQHPPLEDVSGRTILPSLSGAAAKSAGATLANEPRTERWLNYYGPPGTIPSVHYHQNFTANGVPAGFYSNRVVFIGANMAANFSGTDKDSFATPYTRWTGRYAPGVEVHATAFLNLLHGNSLTRLPFAAELAVLLVIGIGAGFGLSRYQPMTGLFATLGMMALVAGITHLLARHQLVWFSWLVPLAQLSVALLWSTVFHSFRLYVNTRVLEQSMSFHLSRAIARQLLKDPELRHPGVKQQEVTILFSDIASYSTITGSMNPNDHVQMLNRYFEAALPCIHETDGTVAQLIGDAIFAVWNAPVEQMDHRERACRAALSLHERLVRFDSAQRTMPLRTRIGLHTGPACVGNIGSPDRFVYTAIGESTNLASRLEGLNKHLGTFLLASREVQMAVEDKLVTRLVGYFKFKGISRPVEIYELIGTPDKCTPADAAWLESFEKALHCFLRGHFEKAENYFRQTIWLRAASDTRADQADGNADGPSSYYLNKISELRNNPPAQEWTGVIEMAEK